MFMASVATSKVTIPKSPCFPNSKIDSVLIYAYIDPNEEQETFEIVKSSLINPKLENEIISDLIKNNVELEEWGEDLFFDSSTSLINNFYSFILLKRFKRAKSMEGSSTVALIWITKNKLNPEKMEEMTKDINDEYNI